MVEARKIPDKYMDLFEKRFQAGLHLLDKVELLHVTIFHIDEIQHNAWMQPELEQAWRALLDPAVRDAAAGAARRRSPEGGAHDLFATLVPLARSPQDRADRRSRP